MTGVVVLMVVGLVLLVGALAALLIAHNLVYLCGPNEALIFSGRRRPEKIKASLGPHR